MNPGRTAVPQGHVRAAAEFRGYGGRDFGMTNTSSSKDYCVHESGSTPIGKKGLFSTKKCFFYNLLPEHQ